MFSSFQGNLLCSLVRSRRGTGHNDLRGMEHKWLHYCQHRKNLVGTSGSGSYWIELHCFFQTDPLGTWCMRFGYTLHLQCLCTFLQDIARSSWRSCSERTLRGNGGWRRWCRNTDLQLGGKNEAIISYWAHKLKLHDTSPGVFALKVTCSRAMVALLP
jgi:hypothetical protein